MMKSTKIALVVALAMSAVPAAMARTHTTHSYVSGCMPPTRFAPPAMRA